MCIPKKNKKKNSVKSEMPLNNSQFASSTNQGEASRKKATRGNRTGSAEKPRVADVHKKISSMEKMEKHHQKTTEQQMKEAMQHLGISSANTTLIQRLEKADKELMEGSQVSTRQGDIQYTLPSRKPKKDDDTLYPLNKNDANINNNNPNVGGINNKNQENDNKESELQEDMEEEPNSENYMWNTREIVYTCHDMIRHIDKTVLNEATGDPGANEEAEQKIEWDPFAPLNILENRPIFDCHILRKNTFLSTALCCSTKAEQKAAKNKSKSSLPKKVTVIEKAKDMSRFRSTEQNSEQMDCTQETVEVTVKSNYKK